MQPNSLEPLKHSPDVTVIVAVLNGAKTLPRLLASLAAQTCRNFELILIDGGSTDGTVEIIQAHEANIAFWVSESDGGIYQAWNKGLARARGEWICFLGADDYLWSNDVLEKMAPYLAPSGQAAGLVYGSIAVVTQAGETLYTIGEPWETARGKLRDAMPAPHPGLMHHRSWFERYGSFDVSFRIAGDYEMLLRGGMKEPGTFIPDLIVAGMTLGGVSSTPKDALKQLREVRRAQKKWGIGLPGWRFISALGRVHLRLIMQPVLGERLTYELLDLGRRMLGKPRHWTRL